MARAADRHRRRGDAAPRSCRQRHDGDRRRAVPFPAELPAPLGVPAAGRAVRAAAVRRGCAHPFPVPGAARGHGTAGRGGVRPPRATPRAPRTPRGHAPPAGPLPPRAPLPREPEPPSPPGPPRAQATAEMFRWPQLVAVTGLKSAHAAIEEIIEQGEGARGDWQSAHYGRFLRIWDEYSQLCKEDPSFDPARPVIPAFTRQPFDISEPQPLLTEPAARTVAELFNLGYETLLQLLTRFFTHTDETDEQLGVLTECAFQLMAGVVAPLGRALTRLPAGTAHPGRTAGPTVEMY